MKANEFRLGNIIIDESGSKSFINRIGSDCLLHPDGSLSDIDNVKAIELTKNHFEDNNFSIAATNYYLHEKLGSIYFSKRIDGWRVETKEGSILTYIKYFHHLQNFFFCITGEELVK